MRKGKMASQAAHASMKVFFDAGSITRGVMHINLTAEMETWAKGIFTKITVAAKDEDELLSIYEQAKEVGLPCSLVQDVGLTEFGGVPTYTAVAVGPALNEDVDKITGGLSLL